MKFKSLWMAMLFAVSLLAWLPAQASDKININTATAAQLQMVKGIGPKTAAAIIAYRNKHGDFKEVDDLDEVKGIGEKKLDKIEDDLTVENGDEDKHKKRKHKKDKHDD